MTYKTNKIDKIILLLMIMKKVKMILLFFLPKEQLRDPKLLLKSIKFYFFMHLLLNY